MIINRLCITSEKQIRSEKIVFLMAFVKLAANLNLALQVQFSLVCLSYAAYSSSPMRIK